MNSFCLSSEKEGKYFHYLVPAEEASVEGQPLWLGRMKEGEKIQKQITEDLFFKMVKKMDELEQRMTHLHKTEKNSKEEEKP